MFWLHILRIYFDMIGVYFKNIVVDRGIVLMGFDCKNKCLKVKII